MGIDFQLGNILVWACVYFRSRVMVVRTLPGAECWSRKNERARQTPAFIARLMQEGMHWMTEDLAVSAVMKQVNKLLDDAGVLPCGRAFILEQLLRSQICYEEPSRAAS